MNTEERAKQIVQVLQAALQSPLASARAGALQPNGTEREQELGQENFTVIRQGCCLSCDPGVCPVCGYLFTGETVVIQHRVHGKFALSDRAIHYLTHGITHYQTSYIVRGEPVSVELDLELLASYLDL